MTKQEILKAIENGESVWLATEYGIKELKKLKLKDGLLTYYNEDYKFNHAVEESYLDNLYKSKAEAEHYLHHANVERVEKLPFLTWEEFNKNTLGFEFVDTIENKYRFHIVRDYRDGKDFIVLYDKNGTISIDEEWEATEENFYKAYDECVRLFRGGE